MSRASASITWGMFTFLSLPLHVPPAVAAPDPECRQIIEANAHTLGLIRTLELHYIIRPPARPVLASQIWWSKEGSRERIKEISGHPPTTEGRPTNIRDLLISSGKTYFLRNWDPTNPQRISPTHQGSVTAIEEPHTNVNPGTRSPAADLLMEVLWMPRRTLSELASVSPSIQSKGWIADNGRKLFCISLETPEETADRSLKWFVEAYVDPTAGYMIRKLILTAPGFKWPNGTTGMTLRSEVDGFRDCGDGIYIAENLRHQGDEGGTECLVDGIKVNQPIPEGQFVMNWPKYVQVRHLPPADGRAFTEIWGDGKAVGVIKQRGDAERIEAELAQDPAIRAEFDLVRQLPAQPQSKGRGPVLLTLAGINLAALAAVVAIWKLRRRKWVNEQL
jgi:hypothetical protein